MPTSSRPDVDRRRSRSRAKTIVGHLSRVQRSWTPVWAYVRWAPPLGHAAGSRPLLGSSSHAWVGVRQWFMTTRTQAALAPAATGGPPSATGRRRPDSEREGARGAPDELVPVASLEFGASERLGASDPRMRRSARFHIVITVAVGAGAAGVLLVGVGWIPRTQPPRQEKAAGSEVVTAALPIHATRPAVRSRGHWHPRRWHRVTRHRSASPDPPPLVPAARPARELAPAAPSARERTPPDGGSTEPPGCEFEPSCTAGGATP